MTEKKSAYFELDPRHTDAQRLKKEREKARILKKSDWWNQLLRQGLCHYCGGKFAASKLTLDHVVPLARGGTSKRGNCVTACEACNREKKLSTPVDQIFAQLALERARKGS